MLKFSVIIPVYNVEEYLTECLDYLFNQTMPENEFEIICIDDGSTDNSSDILEKYRAQRKNMRVIKQENQGQSVGRNKGIKAARGEYIYFHDSDDYLLPETLEELYARANADDLDMLFFQLRAFGDGVDEKLTGQFSKWYVRRKDYPGVYLGKELFFAMQANHDYKCNVPGFIVRRKLLKKAKLLFYPGIVHQDELFTFQAIMKAGRTGYTPKQYYQRRMRPNSVMTSAPNYEDVRGCLVVASEGASTLRQDDFTSEELKVLENHIRKFLNSARTRYSKLPESERKKIEDFPLEMQMIHRLMLDLYPGTLRTYAEQRKHEGQSALIKNDRRGACIYGVGDHLKDMLAWHPELQGKIARAFDKSPGKIGKKADGLGVIVEGPDNLRKLPDGTFIIVAAIRYYHEIVSEIKKINPKLQCLHMDEAYEKKFFDKPAYTNNVVDNNPITRQEIESKIVAKNKIEYTLSGQQKRHLRGLKQINRWRQQLLISCHGRQKIFWGTQGKRAERLRKEFAPLRMKGDIYIEENEALHGKMIDGLPVCKPSVLCYAQYDALIVVLNDDYTRISRLLQADGLTENVDFVEGRKLLGVDENGYIDVPCVDKSSKGMIVYGYGAHILDMVKWHPKLKNFICCIVDKDKEKWGQYVDLLGCRIVAPDALRDLPAGTEIAVSAIRYFSEIEQNIYLLNPGLVVRNIDEVWRDYISF
ncbi:MAG: glycosyltransferase [Selenomonas sp.]|nr:glycosyltransferase [Selenomonas sp.]